MARTFEGTFPDEDFIVVGGGLAGLSVAYELVSRGHGVRLLEAREDVALETSFANGGLLTPSMSDPWNSPGVERHLISSLLGRDSAIKLRLLSVPTLLAWGIEFLLNSRPAPHRAATIATFRLADYSLRATRTLKGELGISYDEMARGTMKVFRSQRALDASIGMAQLLEGEGLKVEHVDRDEAVCIEPQLANVREMIFGALHCPQDECGDAYLFCRALAQHIEARGGRIQRGVTVSGLLREGNRVIGVYGPEGPIRGRAVIVAAGAMTAGLASRVGVRLSIRPAKGYSLTFPVERVSDLPRLPVIDDALHAAVTPLGSRIRVAGTAEFAGEDRSVGADRIANLTKILASIYPQLAGASRFPAASTWAGLRPMSADGLPYIGATRIAGLWINGGHGHLGWTLATGSARLLTDLIEGRDTDLDPAPFRVHR